MVSAELDFARWYSHESSGVQQIPSLSEQLSRQTQGAALHKCCTGVQLVWMVKGEKVVTLGHTLPITAPPLCWATVSTCLVVYSSKQPRLG